MWRARSKEVAGAAQESVVSVDSDYGSVRQMRGRTGIDLVGATGLVARGSRTGGRRVVSAVFRRVGGGKGHHGPVESGERIEQWTEKTQ